TSRVETREHRERFLDVLLHPNLRTENVPNDPLFVDDEGFWPVKKAERRLDAVGCANAPSHVGQELHRKMMMLGESGMRFDRIRADAEHLDPRGTEFVVRIAKRARLDGA